MNLLVKKNSVKTPDVSWMYNCNLPLYTYISPKAKCYRTAQLFASFGTPFDKTSIAGRLANN